jgi:aspartate-semialdehyde dehydrogenase
VSPSSLSAPQQSVPQSAPQSAPRSALPSGSLPTTERIPVAVLGATGSVGQRFLERLAHHPWFVPTELVASERSRGRPYREAARWLQTTPLPASVADLIVLGPDDPLSATVVFSALDARVAGEVEARHAAEGRLVISNARNHRTHPQVPLLIPEVNPDHLALLPHQPWRRPAPPAEGSAADPAQTPIQPPTGGIITNPNCSTIGLVLALKPLHDAFGLREVRVVTLQAISGAGIPGVSSMEILDNVIPYISGEEAKLESEPLKILGSLGAAPPAATPPASASATPPSTPPAVVPAHITLSAQCNRVPVVDGHMANVWVTLERPPAGTPAEQAEALRSAWQAFRPETLELGLPTAPRRPLIIHEGEAHPQPRLHRDLEDGMAVSVGRLRPTATGAFAFVVLSHNTVRGAAGGAILCGELALAQGYLPPSLPAQPGEGA